MFHIQGLGIMAGLFDYTTCKFRATLTPPVGDFSVLGLCLIVKATVNAVGDSVRIVAGPAHRADNNPLSAVWASNDFQFRIHLHIFVAVGAIFLGLFHS